MQAIRRMNKLKIKKRTHIEFHLLNEFIDHRSIPYH